MNRVAGLIEPLTEKHIPPENILVMGENYRETLIANGLLSRNRAVLIVLKELYSTLDRLKQQNIYLLEALTGFANWQK